MNTRKQNHRPGKKSTDRRGFLKGAAAAGAGVALSPYLGKVGLAGASTPPAVGDAVNPFGVAEGSTVDAAIFSGGYQHDYVEFAAEIFEEVHPGTTVNVSPLTLVAQELQPRFVGGNPPDLIDNSGAGSMGINTIFEQLEDLTDVIDAPNLEGVPIRDTLYPGVLSPGTFGDRFVAVNYVFTIYGVWYSGSLFEQHGWTPPTNWDEAIALGAAAQEEGLYLFTWGMEAATYYQTFLIDSAIKEGGDEVRLALANLEEGCWSHPAVQGAFTAMKTVVDEGYMQPGGAGTQFVQAQAQWTLDQTALMYPSGSWIENEMKETTAEGFEMRGVPEWSVTTDSAMSETALRAAAGEPFIVPSGGANVAGAKELLRIMLSEESATYFLREKLAPTIVSGLVPEDGFGSTALVSQTEMLEAANGEYFNHEFVQFYGTNQEQLPIWNSFLSGDKSVEELTSDLQAITDRVREDDSITKVTFE